MLEFEMGRKYSRGDVKQLAGIRRDSRGGPWHTGILQHDEQFLIFANVGTAGRFTHDYGNRWKGPLLRRYHRRGSQLGWASVQRLLEANRVVHVFWRGSNTAPFRYAGYAAAVKVVDESPVKILWEFSSVAPDVSSFSGPDELPPSGYSDGSARRVMVNVFERDRGAREACIKHYGPTCVVCGMNFGQRYGTKGDGFIHVHHLVPISEIGSNYRVNPVQDLRPICPNCHAMVHRKRSPYSLDEVRAMLRE